MEHDHFKRTVKIDPFVGDDRQGSGHDTRIEGARGGGGGLSNVDRLRGYYDEARDRLKNFLGREEAMGSGSSSPRTQDDCGGGGGCGEGGVMFQQRPAHIRLEGKQDINGEGFTDISYSDLGFIITPQSKKITVNNNNYQRSADSSTSNGNCMQCSPAPSSTSADDTDFDVDTECDVVSSTVAGPGSGTHSLVSSTSLSSSTPNITGHNGLIHANNGSSYSNNGLPIMGSLQHRGSDGSFTLAQLPGSAQRKIGHGADNNVDDMRLEEVTS